MNGRLRRCVVCQKPGGTFEVAVREDRTKAYYHPACRLRWVVTRAAEDAKKDEELLLKRGTT